MLNSKNKSLLLNRMSDELFLQNLADFRDLQVVHRPQQRNYASKSSIETNPNNLSPQFQIELQNNDKLIKNFKQLRQQLKQSSKNCQKLKNKLTQKQSEIARYRLSEKDHVAAQYQMKSQIEHLKKENADYKMKIEFMQESAQRSSQQKEELQYLKMLTYDLKNKLEKAEEENHKLMEISVSQKVEFQEKIKRFESKKSSNLQYVQQMEIQVSRLRQKNIKLQNQLKKAEIKYDEQVYHQKWLNTNFEKQYLDQQMQDLEKQNSELQTKYKQQKERRSNLEKNVMQLEEMAGLWTVKAETYEAQNKNYLKKFKKLEKKMKEAKLNADTQIQQALNWQQKFMKSVSITEELINRVKRDLYGDVVNLAKSCEYRINKLKEEKDSCFKHTSPMRKSPSISKLRAKSKPTLINKQFAQTASPIQRFDKYTRQPSTAYKKTFFSHQKQQNICRTFSNQDLKDAEEQRGNKDQFPPRTYSKENIGTPLGHIENIEIKIRRERQQMEKKIRQKLIYRKIEAAANSPQKHRLREDYFRLIDT